MEMDLSALEAEVDQYKKEIEGLGVENDTFQAYITRHEASMGQAGLSRKKHRPRNAPQRLTMEQKLEVANQVLEVVAKDTEAEALKTEKILDSLRAFSEHADLRVAELKRDAYEFKRDIVVGAENPRTGKTMAEKVVRYMEDRLRARDAQVEKLRLKNATLRNQISKSEAQLRQKEEMGEVLHYIDFHQLQIENKQYLQKIEERNAELLRLKMTTGRTFQSLNTHKSLLAKVLEEQERIDRELGNQTKMLERLRDENTLVVDEVAAEKRLRKRMSQAQADTGGAPQILDYVNQKKLFYDLEDQLRNWERKMDILRMANRRLRQEEKRYRLRSRPESLA